MSEFMLKDSEIRNLITKWSDSIPHHGHRDLGEKITIKSVDNIPVHRMLLYSQSVSRYVNMETTLLGEGGYDNNNYLRKQDIDCWSYSFTPPTTYKDEGTYFIVDNSQHSITCHTCTGKGIVKCPTCNEGKVRCSACNGTGDRTTTVNCGNCGGSGSIRSYHQEAKIVGYKDNTPITRYENVQTTKRCTSCGGSGKQKSIIYGGCRTCHGSGQVTCSTCNGRGTIMCVKCAGKGLRLEYAELHTRLSTHKDDYIVCGEMGDAELKMMLKDVPLTDYKRDKVIKSSDGQLKNIDFETAFQNKIAKSMLEKGVKAVWENGRILFEEIQLKTVKVLAVNYSYDELDYVIYIVNNESRTIIADNSPIKGTYKELMAKAVESANDEHFNKALRILKKCQDFPQTDQKDEEFKQSIYYGMTEELSFGIKLGVYVFSLIFLPQILLYFLEHNYVLSYVSFINEPSNYAYGATWVNAILAMFVAIRIAKRTKDWPLPLAKWLPSKRARIFTGILLSTVIMLAATAVVAVLNMVGLIPILDYAFMFCFDTLITIIAFIVMGVISIFN